MCGCVWVIEVIFMNKVSISDNWLLPLHWLLHRAGGHVQGGMPCACTHHHVCMGCGGTCLTGLVTQRLHICMS